MQAHAPADAVALHLRDARAGDADALAQLSAQLGYALDPARAGAHLAAIVAARAGIVRVAQAGPGPVIAWMHTRVTHALEYGAYAEILGFVVADGWRSRGVGALLLADAEAWAQRQGLTELRVRSNVVRERAHAFYLRHGFHERKRQACFSKALAG